MIQLDTSFLIRSLLKRSSEDRRLRTWLREGELVGIAALAWTEFLCGPVSEAVVSAAAELVGSPIHFGGPEAARAAGLFNATGRRRGTLLECMIAATALESGAALATADRADFQRFVPLGLRLAD